MHPRIIALYFFLPAENAGLGTNVANDPTISPRRFRQQPMALLRSSRFLLQGASSSATAVLTANSGKGATRSALPDVRGILPECIPGRPSGNGLRFLCRPTRLRRDP